VSLELLHQSFLRGPANFPPKGSKMTFAAYKVFPTVLGSMQITSSPLTCLRHDLSLLCNGKANHLNALIARAAPKAGALRRLSLSIGHVI
jgi:hypothetical protein